VDVFTGGDMVRGVLGTGRISELGASLSCDGWTRAVRVPSLSYLILKLCMQLFLGAALGNPENDPRKQPTGRSAERDPQKAKNYPPPLESQQRSDRNGGGLAGYSVGTRLPEELLI
jgi:hypothetical protein